MNTFSPRAHFQEGAWLSDHRRYFEYAHLQLLELEIIIEEVKRQWPVPLDQPLQDGEYSQSLRMLSRKRDLLSDSVKVFSAMAVEGFLNFYGVIHLGQAEYDRDFIKPRVGLIPKLRRLLCICDSLSVPDEDILVKTLERIANRRNALVHPKTREFSETDRDGDKLPEVAREAVKEMEEFFREFVRAVPKANGLIQNGQPA